MKKACIISNTPEPRKTYLQLNVSELGTCDAFRVASAGNTHEDDPMEVDALSRKGKGKGKSSKGKKGGKKGKDSHTGKGYGETTPEHSRFETQSC